MANIHMPLPGSLELDIPLGNTSGSAGTASWYLTPAQASFVDVAGLRPSTIGGQAWFWTEAWQAGEKRVDELLERGEIEAFDDMDEFLASLNLNE
jgi:hypothetical protein